MKRSVRFVLLLLASLLAFVPVAALAWMLVGDRFSASSARASGPSVRSPSPLVRISITDRERRRWRTVPTNRRAIPVLAYQAVTTVPGTLAVTPSEFARQMSMLRLAGFRTITTRQFARFLAGVPAALPRRPILIMFEDGRADSWLNADAALAANGFRAVMTVVARPKRSDTFYLSRSELLRMQRSGRWELQAHAGPAGHNPLPGSSSDERIRPFYSNLITAAGGRRESIAAFRRRVKVDVSAAAKFVRTLSGVPPVAFVYPYGETGADGYGTSNDRRVPGELQRIIAQRFPIAFVSFPPDVVRLGDPRTSLRRLSVVRATGADRLYCFLRDRLESRSVSPSNPRCPDLETVSRITLQEDPIK